MKKTSETMVTYSTTHLTPPCDRRPQLIMTLGDPSGIGPEVVLKTLSNPVFDQNADISVIGDRTHLQTTYHQLKAAALDINLRHPDTLNFIDIKAPNTVTSGLKLGVGNSSSGEIGFRSLQSAIALTTQGSFDGIVHGPHC